MATNNTGLLMPFWNGKYYFDKPPMYFWLSYPIFKIFGPGEWQARAVSATAAVLTVLMIFIIGKKLFNYKIGLVAAVIFLTLGQVVERFSHGNLDALVTLFSILSFYFYIASKSNKSRVLSGIFLGSTVLTKGIVFGFYPLIWILIYEYLLGKRRVKSVVLVVLVSLTVSLWWYIYGILKFGKEFISSFILDPFAGNLSWKNPKVDFTLFKVLIRDVGFWLAPVALCLFKNFKNKLLWFLMLSVLVLSFPLNLLADKLGWFLLPVYPFVSLVIGYSILNFGKKYIFLLLLLIILQFNHVKRIELELPDRSLIGAKLGMFTKMNFNPETKLVLDSPDFPSFIYYSGLDEVTVTIQNGGKANEWWIVSHDDISEFKDYIIITKDPQKFNKDMQTITTAPYGYKLLKL